MIQANELRIGNIVSDFGGREARVSAITERGTIKLSSEHYTDESFNLNERVINPIPLTEEWLLRFGFMRTYAERTYKKAFNEYSLHEFYVTISSPDNILSIGDNYSSAGKKIMVFTHNAVQHVHQLQNLYFALTGQELKQKEG